LLCCVVNDFVVPGIPSWVAQLAALGDGQISVVRAPEDLRIPEDPAGLYIDSEAKAQRE
jgi:hypothetical protein